MVELRRGGGDGRRKAAGFFAAALVCTAAASTATASRVAADPAAVCADASAHPEWIFCDDFEAGPPTVGVGRYFEIDGDDGDFRRVAGAGRDGSFGMRTEWQRGEVGAGGLKVAFGRNPNGYMNKTRIRPTEDFREIWYRLDVRHDVGWQGDPAKLSRATVFASADDWRQAMIAHLWGDGKGHLLVDPARCVDPANGVKCTKYNDFDKLDWLGNKPGTTPVFDTANGGRWFCVVHHVRLNDPGQANGVQEFFIDGRLEARREGLDFVRGYQDFALNAVFVENYWNDGAVKDEGRDFDNLVISTGSVECPAADGGGGGTATATATVEPATVTVEPTSAATATATPTLVVTRHPTATAAMRWFAYLPRALRLP
ncbi:MAG: hypothetical protein ABI780_06755 [Ardenticatenales bacterium]